MLRSLALAALLGCPLLLGCAMPKYVSVNELRPAPYHIGTSPQVALVEVEGGRRDMQDVVAQALVRHSREDGFFVVQDRRSAGIRFDSQGGRMVMQGAPVSVGSDDVFIKALVLDQYAEDQRGTVRQDPTLLEALRGEGGREIEVVQTTVPVAFTVGTAEGVLFEQKEYEGAARWKLGEHPSDRRARSEYAAAEAVRAFLADITPRYINNRVRLDDSDKGQEQILAAASRGSVREAADLMRRYAERNSNSASAWYNLAAMTDALGSYGEAIALYDRAISLGGQPWYVDSKTEAMRRLNEQGLIAEEREQPRRVPAPEPQPELAPQPEVPDGARRFDEVMNREPERREPSRQAPAPNEDVRRAQACLNTLGYNCGTADGLMGPATQGCIRAFQEASGLGATGQLDAATRRAIGPLCG